jgi:probable HAF family extracellular repeat protein
MKRSAILFIVLFCALGAMPLQGRAAASYQVTVIGPANSAAYDINRSGQIAGNLQNGSATSRAFYYDGIAVQDLGTLPGAAYSTAGGLNDYGIVVGNSGPTGVPGFSQGFLYANGILSNLSASPESMATKVNNAGIAVGMALVSNSLDPEGSFANHAASFYPGGLLDLTDGIGFPARVSEANDINDAGTAVGTVHDAYQFAEPMPFMYREGAMRYLGDGEHWYGAAFAINNHDQVAGRTYGLLENGGADTTRMQAAMYDNGRVRELGALREGGNSGAWDINDAGHVVGWTDTPAGASGFLYLNGEMRLLDSLIDPASGWTIHDAHAINAVDQIAATACRAGICQAVRLDPLAAVPEPVQRGMWGAGLVFLLARLGMPAGRRRPPPSRNIAA